MSQAGVVRGCHSLPGDEIMSIFYKNKILWKIAIAISGKTG